MTGHRPKSIHATQTGFNGFIKDEDMKLGGGKWELNLGRVRGGE